MRNVKLAKLFVIILLNLVSLQSVAEEVRYQPMVIERTAEGVSANGKSYIDPNARMELVSAQSDTGDLLYAIREPVRRDGLSHQYKVRRVALLGNRKPVDVGFLDRDVDRQWTYTTTEGDSFSGDVLILGSRGILLIRSNKVLVYAAPEGTPQAIEIPDGYVLSPVQKGDISFTQHVLLGRELQPKMVFGFTLTSPAKKYLMAQMNIMTGELALTFPMKFQDEQELDNRYYVFGAASGPLQIALEEGHQRIVVRNLFTNQSKVAFERENGIAEMQVNRKQNGKIVIEAAVGFSNQRVEDVEALLQNIDAPKTE